MLTAAVLEGLFYGDFSVFSLPVIIYNGTFNYLVAVPCLALMQVYYMGNHFKLFTPSSMQAVWSQKHHVSNFWKHVDMHNPEHFAIWTSALVIFAVLNYKSVSARLVGLSKMKIVEPVMHPKKTDGGNPEQETKEKKQESKANDKYKKSQKKKKNNKLKKD